MVSRRLADVRLERQSATRSRRPRRPSHPFRLVLRPWQIVPMVFAPVLAGDTIQTYSMQARVLSDPIKDKLAGWWCETYMFYVRVGDLEGTGTGGALRDLMIQGTPLAGAEFDAPEFYTVAGAMPLMSQCYDQIVKFYFRDEGVSQTFNVGDYAAAKIVSSSWWDSAMADGELAAPTTDDPPDWDDKWVAYQNLRNARLTTATWAEYLAMQGVSTPPVLEGIETAQRKPELLRFVRDFQYPVNAVEPSTGVPAALVQWTLADRMPRRRSLAEPGFLVGCMVVRPKAYLGNQNTNAASVLMNTAEAWLPSALDSDPHARLRLIRSDDPGPIEGALADYWLDPKDLLDRGDQWVSGQAGDAADTYNKVSLPTISAGGIMNMLYPSATDADNVFSGAAKRIRVDGICSFQILSRGGGTDATGRTGSW